MFTANPSRISSRNRLYGTHNKKNSVIHKTALVVRHETILSEDSQLLYMSPRTLEKHGVIVKNNRIANFFVDIQTRSVRSIHKFLEQKLLADVQHCVYLRRRRLHDRNGYEIHVHGVMATVRLLDAIQPPLVAAEPGKYEPDKAGALRFFSDELRASEII